MSRGARAAAGVGLSEFTLYSQGAVVNAQSPDAVKNRRWPSQAEVITRQVRPGPRETTRWAGVPAAPPIRRTGLLVGLPVALGRPAPAPKPPDRSFYGAAPAIPTGIDDSIAAVGGIVISGSAGVNNALSAAGSGAVTIAGSATAAMALAATGVGGVVLGGSATGVVALAATGAGEVAIGGAADLSASISPAPSVGGGGRGRRYRRAPISPSLSPSALSPKWYDRYGRDPAPRTVTTRSDHSRRSPVVAEVLAVISVEDDDYGL